MGMGGCLLYPHSVLQFPSFSAFSPPKFRKPLSSIKEISDRSLVLSIRADGKKSRPNKNPYQGRASKTEGADDDTAQSFDGKSSLSPNKEEILALFKRIQSSISKGETVTSKKRTSKNAEDKPSSTPSAESILEVLHQSRTQRKGKSVGKKDDKFPDTQKDSLKKEESAEYISTRPPSSFSKRSPIPTLSSPREELQSANETKPALPSDETELTNDILPSTGDENDQQASNLAEMKLPQLKEVAKSKGIKGYSKLKKSELVELLLKSVKDSSP